MSIATRINAIEEHIGNAYNKLDDLGIDSTGVDKNIDNIAEMLEEVYQDYPKVTGQGTEITLDGTKAGKLGLDIKGNRVQDGTPTPTNEVPIYSAGDDINICPTDVSDWEQGAIRYEPGISYSNAKEDNLKRIRIKNLIALDTNETYNLSFNSDYNIVIQAFDNSQNMYSNSSANVWKSTAFNISGIPYIAVAIKKSDGSNITLDDLQNVKLKIQEGSIATPYSPYNMGTISEKIVNKNFFDYENSKVTGFYGTSSTKTENGFLGGWGYYITFPKPIPAGTYNISFKVSNNDNSGGALINVQDINNTSISGGNIYIGTAGNKTKTFTSTEQIKRLRIDNGQNSVTTLIYDIQIEQGSTATTYVAHQEQTYTIPVQQPMRSIGTVRDEFIQDTEGNWFERHNIVRYIFTGNENWGGAPSVVTGTARFYIEKSDIINDNNVQIKRIYSNRFKALTWDEIYQSDTTTINAISNYNSNTDAHRIVIRIDSTIASTKSELNTYLSNNPTYADYVATTPVDLPCTAEQVEYLENLPKSYNEQTNIYSLDVTPAYIEAEALLDIEDAIGGAY